MFTSALALIVATMASATDGSTPAPQPTAAPAAPSATQNVPATEARPGDRVICKKITATGSRLGATKICKTADEWAGINRDGKDLLMNIQQRNYGNKTAGGG